jgi:hypothetical protein
VSDLTADQYLAKMIELGDVVPTGEGEGDQQQFRLTQQGMDRAKALLEAAGILVVDDATVDELMGGILDHLAENDGKLVITRDAARNVEWMVGYEFGHEEPDNPENDMAGGASYGMAPNLRDALRHVFDEIGATVPEES